MKRQTSLKTSLAAGASFTLLPPGLWSSTKKNSTMQLAQIGTGRKGQGDMMNALNHGKKRHVNARMVAVCDVNLYYSSNHMEDFLRSAREGKDPICPVEIGHRSNTICVLHDVSMKLGGRKLNWDSIKEVVVGDDEANKMINVPMRAPYTFQNYA